jgi:hypothetical protein
VDVTTTITGNGVNVSHTVSDNTFAYHRFDSFALRPNTLESTAASFNFTRFKVEVLGAATPPPSIPLNIQLSGNNVTLSWANPAFVLQASPDVTGTYTNVPNATSPFSSLVSGSRQFFRLRGN